MLRRVVGDETFFAALREYRRRHERGNATRADLRAVFEELSGRDLKQFFDQWVETPYRPVLRASYRNLAGRPRRGDGEADRRRTPSSTRRPDPGDTPHYRFPLVLRVFSATSAASTAVVERDEGPGDVHPRGPRRAPGGRARRSTPTGTS